MKFLIWDEIVAVYDFLPDVFRKTNVMKLLKEYGFYSDEGKTERENENYSIALSNQLKTMQRIGLTYQLSSRKWAKNFKTFSSWARRYVTLARKKQKMGVEKSVPKQD